jgi:hypothetical protein
LVVTAVAYLVVYLPGEQRRYQSKYQDYRALAEGMRVQFFWRLANLTPSVADHYLRKHKGELEWIRSALRAWNMSADVEERSMPPGSGPDDKTRMQRVLTHWVTRESQYFTTAAKRNKAQLEGYESWIRGLLRTSVGLAVILALVLLLPHPWRHQFPEWLHNYHLHGVLLVLIGIASIGAALLHSYAEQSVLSEHAKQYARMSRTFARAEQRLREMVGAERYKDAQKLVAELGREALADNGDWVLLHREETIQMPHAG